MRLVNFSVEEYFLITQLGNFCLMKSEREGGTEIYQNILCKFVSRAIHIAQCMSQIYNS